MDCCIFNHKIKWYDLVLNFKRNESVQESGMSKIWLMVLGLIVTLVIMAQFPDVFADSIEEEIKSLQIKLASYDELITAQKSVMADSAKLVKEKKEELRIA